MATDSILNSAIIGDRLPLYKRLMLLRVGMLITAALGLAFLKWRLGSQQSLTIPFFLLVGAGIYSIGYWFKARNAHNISEIQLLTHLTMDATLLCSVVYFTGGANNPFIYYLLVLIAIVAALFDLKKASIFCAACILTYSLMLWLNQTDHLSHMGADFQLHLTGMWLNFVGSAVLITYFIHKLSDSLRTRQQQLASVREETLKNEQLIGIGTLAASTAHALGTPLSTMKVILGEMYHEHQGEERENIVLMQEQLDRCKTTLQRLSQISEPVNAEQYEQLVEFVESLTEYFLLSSPSIIPKFHLPEQLNKTEINRSLLLHHAIINLIDNALQAAKSRVDIQFSVNNTMLVIDIMDDGNGIPHDVVENWGQPLKSAKSGGLGIGIFLANSTIEKHQGTVTLLKRPIEQVNTPTQAERQIGTVIRVQLKLPKHSSVINTEAKAS